MKNFKYFLFLIVLFSLLSFTYCTGDDGDLSNDVATILDADSDGVSDDKDSCDDTPSGATVDLDGCAASQKDTDGDGVNDDLDFCDDTAIGTTVDANGCQIFLYLDEN